MWADTLFLAGVLSPACFVFFCFHSCGIQTKNAKHDTTAYIPSAPCAPCQPKPRKEEIGTLDPDPNAPNIFIDTAYIPVIMPICKGKLSNPQMFNRTFAFLSGSLFLLCA